MIFQLLLVVVTVLCLPMPAAAVSFTDWWTSASTKIALLAEPSVAGTEVSAIEVEARGDVVTLRGRVATHAAQAAAGDVALRIPGVRAVTNDLRVDDDTAPAVRRSNAALRTAVSRALRHDARLARSPLIVTVDNGIVRLTGAVPTVWGRVRASEVARAVDGVVAVQNDAGPLTVALEGSDLARRPPRR
jgi:osmotically-inducible protein OsmY